VRTVALAGTAGSPAGGGRAELNAKHIEIAFAMFDKDFAEKDFAKALYMERVTLASDAGTVGVHLFDAGTKEGSVGAPLRQAVAGLEGILGYFPEF